jgi:hypothetical protein
MRSRLFFTTDRSSIKAITNTAAATVWPTFRLPLKNHSQRPYTNSMWTQ